MRIDVQGRAAYAYTAGRAFDPARPTVVFVHGAANDHSVWLLQSRYFAYHGHNVLAVDLPGHGRSSGEALTSIGALADFIIALQDATGVARAVVVGHSMGSLAALEAAARCPERIAKIALIGIAVPLAVSDLLLDAARRDDHLAFELINGWSFSAEKWQGGNRLPGVHLAGNALRLLERTRPGVLAAGLLACRQYDSGIAAARKVRCPALLVLGGRDLMAPPRSTEALIATLVDKEVHTFPASGHALMAEEPDAVLDRLRGFI